MKRPKGRAPALDCGGKRSATPLLERTKVAREFRPSPPARKRRCRNAPPAHSKISRCMVVYIAPAAARSRAERPGTFHPASLFQPLRLIPGHRRAPLYVSTLALTLTLSHSTLFPLIPHPAFGHTLPFPRPRDGEREQPLFVFWYANNCPADPVARYFKIAAGNSPCPVTSKCHL